ncbi:hypothetical protein CONLIGDRAFT_667083 [Coniochaeta ligniaria NRRL 30616]|uniref:Uncharacterized protein n=1 Tax=Coniochaeta ligniaria NRRL 30616 TaxID=1408157 RepID=A0A1J7J1F0_9PEZI|nr:hypothetical protein CONLIGDRAFT_667083 [Coniochaeta ligniaria NRRL 30616]
MGCTSSKQQSSKEETSVPNHGGNRHELTPAKPIKSADAYKHTRSADHEAVPAGWSHRTVNEPTRSKTATGRSVSLAPPTGFPGYPRRAVARILGPDSAAEPSDRAQSRITEGTSATGLTPAWDRVANRVADRGDAGHLTKASVDESLAHNLSNGEWMKTNLNSFVNNPKKAEANRAMETGKKKAGLCVL